MKVFVSNIIKTFKTHEAVCEFISNKKLYLVDVSEYYYISKLKKYKSGTRKKCET